MKILRLGHAMYAFATRGGKRYLIDPFFDLNPGCPEKYTQTEFLQSVDGVLLTHGHFDHVSGLSLLKQANPEVLVVCQYELGMLLIREGFQNVYPINLGGSVALEGVTATMVPARHTSSYRETEGNPIYAGESAGYVLEFTGDHTVYHSGDTAITMDMKLIQDLYEPKIAILSASGHFTMGPREAAYAVRNLLRVRYVIPSHTFPTEATAARKDVWQNLVQNVPAVNAMMGRDEELAELLQDDPHTRVVILGYGEERDFDMSD
ncbi:metal-dependent hydrolase [Kyrpidia spormannii]|uniref:Metal-dependent hydrolase n=2 Tax=Kyrpidia spormannii TaxID=2055160 RepID=A0ACA8Z951_9BACL|nr:metal-dependent hydrolase [Kyrpidia spormannii]CAB3392240.1 Metal-dependent hydrolase [Kyrpidia spormannii]CAB3393162.1 Metal-dependent hydrolase [Kyrpidia spormannii]